MFDLTGRVAVVTGGNRGIGLGYGAGLVNAGQPGWIETPFVASYKQDDTSNRAVEQRTPARRWGQPRDLEGIAVYLTSDASRFHTGDTIRIDGGYAVT